MNDGLSDCFHGYHCGVNDDLYYCFDDGYNHCDADYVNHDNHVLNYGHGDSAEEAAAQV